MQKTLLKSEKQRPRGLGWRSVDQLAEMWGMDAARARLVVGALLDNGRMEQQTQVHRNPLFRLVG